MDRNRLFCELKGLLNGPVIIVLTGLTMLFMTLFALEAECGSFGDADCGYAVLDGLERIFAHYKNS